ncbi:MAG: HYR domain-containing protein, partial [Bacteroidetes bacterium]
MRRFYVYLQLSIACTFSLALWMNAARAVSSAPGVHTGLPSEIPALSDAILADTIPPVIICPPNDTLILDPGLCDTVYTYTVTAMDSLMPIVPSQLGGLASGEAVPIGTTTNTFLAVDTAGNSATCFFSVTVQPATYIISCRDTTHVYLGGDCTVSVMPTEALYSPYGCPDGFVLEADQTPPFGDGPWEAPFFDAADRGKNLGLRVTDNSTGEKCFSVVHIQDTIAPVLDCPAVHVPCALPNGDLTPEFLKDSLGISAGMPTLTENCPNLLAFNHVDVHQDFPCDSPGTITGIITRFWTVLDASGNLATCVQTINRHRDLDNVLFPADTLISCAQDTVPAVTGGPYIQVNNRRYNLLTAPFCEIQATYTDSIAPLCGGSRRLYRTWMVRDACRPDTVGNPVLGMQEIEIEDDRALSLDCPPEVIVQVQTSGCLGTVDLPDIVVRDTCSWVTQVQVFWSVDGVPDTLTASLSDFPGNDPASSDTMAVFGMVSDFPAGQTNLRYVATDACGNTASCDLTLTVWDSIPPAAQCDSSLVVFLDDQGRATIPASLADGGSADSCGNVFFKIYRDLAGTCDTLGNQLDDMLNFCCADLGDTVLAVLRVYDVPVPAGIVPDSLAAGQYSECTVPVQIRDDNAPQCQPPADIQVLCADFDPALDTYGQPIPSCRVDSVFTAVDYTQFDTLCRQGVIERTFQVFDATGISGQCTQTITVNNEQFYYVRFPDDLSITMCDTSGNYGEPELFGVVCEKMDVSMEEAVVFQVPDACFRIERTWTIINWCTYNPNEPLIEVPNPNPNALPIHPDNLPGPVVSEPGADSPWTATVVKINPGDPNPTDYSTFWMADANGYTYKQVIKVIDIEQPVFIDCPDTSVVFVDSSANDFFLWNGNYSPDPGNPDQDLCEGNAPVQVTITDACFGPDLGVDFLLFLDLDEDGMQESVVSSTDLPAAGTIRYNNINNPNYSGGDAKLFDFR